MQRRHVVMLVCFALALAGVLSGSAQTWSTVKSWTGNVTKETESFEIKSREWRISWEAKPTRDPKLSLFNIGVYNEKDLPVSQAGGATGNDVTYVRGAGRYYLKITSANVEWSVSVEDQR